MKRACRGVSAVVILFATGCGGGSAPTSPSHAAVESPTDTLSMSTSSAPALFGASVVDFASCLQPVRATGCFTATRIQTRAVGAAITAPGPPLNLSGSSSGSTVTLTWSAPIAGDPVTTYVLEAGSAPGLADLASFPTGPATSFSANGIGAGSYYVRVLAVNAGGTSVASNPWILIVGGTLCTSAPDAPGSLSSAVSGSTISLAWRVPTAGCPATSYVLQAGSSPGLSNLANANVGNTTSYVANGVGAGSYYVRVRATNANGQSGASNEVVPTVGTTSPSPSPTTGDISFRGTGGCGYIFPPLGDGWQHCMADVTVTVDKVVTSGYVQAYINWACRPGEDCASVFVGQKSVGVGSRPGKITIPTTSTYLPKSKCFEPIPVVIDIGDGSLAANAAKLLYTVTTVWRGFGC